jgi:hypothetical protein
MSYAVQISEKKTQIFGKNYSEFYANIVFTASDQDA